ncbi:MAG: hypothetical protein HXY35_05450 [Chloroflexi bacterium]|nr:hypothetical protein [Chloroflexota bacterium]
MGKKLAENPIVIVIGLLASIIAIYSFVTGKQSIRPPIVEISPAPSLSADLSIENIAFCESQFFDDTHDVCSVSQEVIPQGTSIIYVSWTYKGNYSGEYTRRWYGNGVYLDNLTRPDQKWGADGETDYTYVSYQKGLVAGDYKLEFRLNADNGVIASAGFTVR